MSKTAKFSQVDSFHSVNQKKAHKCSQPELG